jgi:hypothetical protein
MCVKKSIIKKVQYWLQHEQRFRNVLFETRHNTTGRSKAGNRIRMLRRAVLKISISEDWRASILNMERHVTEATNKQTESDKENLTQSVD